MRVAVLFLVVSVSFCSPVLAQSSMLQSGSESNMLQADQTSQEQQHQMQYQPTEQQPQYQPAYQPYQPQLAQPNPNALQIGTTWNEANLGEMESQWKWFVIPEWLAGKWHRTIQKAKFLGMFSVEMKADRDRVYGFQTDELGRIWHLVRVPYKAKVLRSYGFDMFVIHDEKLVNEAPNAVTLQIDWTRYVVQGGIVREVKEGYQLDKIERLDTVPATTKTTSKGTGFKANWTDTKTQEYVPIESYRGINLPNELASFRAQLKLE